MPKNEYEEYAVIDAKIKALTAQKESLRVYIVENMVSKGEEKVSTPVGNFTIAKVKSWTYSEKVTELEEEYRAQKAREESTGEAEFVEKPSLRFIQIRL
jgi:hypothetical protein